MSTRESIMDVALLMFSERGYEAVSIRDICGEVGIKESTLYYHFINKKDILDSLVEKFRTHIEDLLSHVDEITENPSQKKGKNADLSVQMVDSYMIDSYLFDPFCNLMLRLMMIEQFHNEEIRELYEKTLFTDPYEIQMNIFKRLASAGVMPEEDVEWIVRETHSYMTMLTFKYLLNGDLTEKRKKAYYKEVHDFMARKFKA